MSKKFQVKVNGKPFAIDIDDFSGNVVDLKVDGKSYAIEFEESGSPVIQSSAKPVQTSSSSPAPVRTSTPTSAASTPVSDSDTITAPMPGVIMDISVKPGDKVTPGQPVCALEAMKMKNILRSQREGTVASVDVTEGQHVPYGAVLIRFA
jgi:glutaconyl-CoA/methylmalonyl-CoA decarboxylase subunit gamma